MEIKVFLENLISKTESLKKDNDVYLTLGLSEEVGRLSRVVGLIGNPTPQERNEQVKIALENIFRYSFLLCYKENINIEDLFTKMLEHDIDK